MGCRRSGNFITAYLQVAEDNHRALSVYRRLGFATAYTYHYRARPGEDH